MLDSFVMRESVFEVKVANGVILSVSASVCADNA